jgi:hypothetical protein
MLCPRPWPRLALWEIWPWLIAEEIEEEWQNMKNIILDAANDNMGHETRKPCKDWWDGECELIAKEINKAGVKWKTRSTLAEEKGRKRDVGWKEK